LYNYFMLKHKPPRIAAVSDQAIYLRGLAQLLMSIPAVQLVGQARSWAEAVQLCELTEPGFLLLDLKNILERGREIIQEMNLRWPAMCIVLLVEARAGEGILEGFEALPVYSISRDSSEEEFIAALEGVCRDRTSQPSGSHQYWHAADVSEDGAQETRKVERHQIELRDNELVTRELAMAGKIQADILPEIEPSIPGWDISASLEPARETSGDFFDFIPLADHKWGIAVADVSDKGMGAALFMALSSSLIRTYAGRFPTLPAVVLSAVNERLLSDTRGGMFVTSFFAILETHTGRLVYANAGHPPGFIISTAHGREDLQTLRPTGMALGVSEQTHWKQKNVRLGPGDFLVLYTDGITEAQNSKGVFFEEDRLLDVVLSKTNCAACEIKEALLNEVHRFTGSDSRQDDIALLVIRREP
jgi:serine phosphatase RsbU (regulator of sigma subunit)